MPVPITCNGCGVKMTAPDAAINKRVVCPQCKTAFVVPDPNAAEGFEVVEDEPLLASEIIEDVPPVPAAPAVPTVAKAVAPADAKPASTSRSKVLQKNLRRKKKIDASDYLTKVNGKPIAVREGEAPPPPIPRKSPPRS